MRHHYTGCQGSNRGTPLLDTVNRGVRVVDYVIELVIYVNSLLVSSYCLGTYILYNDIYLTTKYFY